MSDASVTCPGCGESAPDDSKFCKECGGRLGAAPCAGCGETLEGGSKFCRHCGASAGAAPAAPRAASASAPPSAPEPEDDPVAERAPRQAPPPAESRTAVYLGVGVAVLGFVWLTVNKQGTPPPPPPVAADPHTGHDHPPAGGGGAAPPAGGAVAPAAAGPAITGTISVHASLQGQTPAGGHFFVIARPAGSKSPMPLAVVRLPASASPTPYSLGPENVMGGGPFAGPMDLSVRWDQDGSAGKQPGDLTGVAGQPFAPGASGADVVLTQKL